MSSSSQSAHRAHQANTSHSRLIAAILLVTFISVGLVGTASAQTFEAVADAYTKDKDSSRNFGNESTVRAQKWSNITGFAMFDLSPLVSGGPVSSAVLVLSVDTVSLSASVDVHPVLGSWTESSLTAGNRPPLGVARASFRASSRDEGGLISVDVTELVNAWITDGSSLLGIALSTDDGNVWFDSRERGSPMRIEVSGGSGSGDDGGSDGSGSTGSDGDGDSGGSDGSDGGDSGGSDGSDGGGSGGSDGSGDGDSGSGNGSDGSPGDAQTLAVVADAYTKDKDPNRNFGRDSTVRAQSWSDITGFLQFDLSSFDSSVDVSSATLRIPLSEVRKAGRVTIHPVLGAWSETAITAGNRPDLGNALADFQADDGSSGDTLNVDVTDLVNRLSRDPARNFGIAMRTGSANVWMLSRESGTPILLDLVLGSSNGGGDDSPSDPSGTGSVTLSWTPPTRNTDGSQLTDLDGYRIDWSNRDTSATGFVSISNEGLSSYVIDDLPFGTYEFRMVAINAGGVASSYSNAAVKTVP